MAEKKIEILRKIRYKFTGQLEIVLELFAENFLVKLKVILEMF